MNLVPILKYVGAGVVGAAVGSALTYFFLDRHLEKKWQAIADEQVASVKDHYKIIRKEGELSDPENLVAREQHRGEDFNENYPKDAQELKELADALVDAGYVTVSEELEGGASDEQIIAKLKKRQEIEDFDDFQVKDVIDQNVFNRQIPTGPDGAPNDPRFPYVISIDEFAAPEDDQHAAYDTVTITYYAGDKTLLDSQGGIELDVNGVVGVENLTKFGHLSEDENIVYVRNERLAIMFEVVRIEEGYAASRGMSYDPDEEDGHIKARRKSKARQATAEFKES